MYAPDLRGYGDSDTHSPHDKGTLARDLAALLDALGHERALIAGHDRGARVAQKYVEVERHVGVVRATVSVRYTK